MFSITLNCKEEEEEKKKKIEEEDSRRRRRRTAQWVERPTEKPGAILKRVRVPREAARDFIFSLSLPESTFSADCLLLRCQYSPRVQAHTSASVR